MEQLGEINDKQCNGEQKEEQKVTKIELTNEQPKEEEESEQYTCKKCRMVLFKASDILTHTSKVKNFTVRKAQRRELNVSRSFAKSYYDIFYRTNQMNALPTSLKCRTGCRSHQMEKSCMERLYAQSARPNSEISPIMVPSALVVNL